MKFGFKIAQTFQIQSNIGKYFLAGKNIFWFYVVLYGIVVGQSRFRDIYMHYLTRECSALFSYFYSLYLGSLDYNSILHGECRMNQYIVDKRRNVQVLRQKKKLNAAVGQQRAPSPCSDLYNILVICALRSFLIQLTRVHRNIFKECTHRCCSKVNNERFFSDEKGVCLRLISNGTDFFFLPSLQLYHTYIAESEPLTEYYFKRRSTTRVLENYVPIDSPSL